MGGQVKVMVGDETACIEDDLLQARAARAFRNALAKGCCLGAIKFERKMHGKCILTLKRSSKACAICDVAMDDWQAQKGRTCHRIWPTRPCADLKAAPLERIDKRNALIGRGAEHNDL